MPDPTVTLPDPEMQPAIDKLRAVGVLGAKVQLSDGRTLVYRGGPFGSVEVCADPDREAAHS